MCRMQTKLLVSTIVMVWLANTPAHAELKTTDPSIVCKFLNARGLITGSWKDYGSGGGSNGNFGCTSPYREIGSGFPLPNNLAYYVDGKLNSVTQAKLVLNINNTSEATSAHSALLTSSEDLGLKITGEKLPQAIKNAIAVGDPTKMKVGRAFVEVRRDNWPTGKGYELHVIFK